MTIGNCGKLVGGFPTLLSPPASCQLCKLYHHDLETGEKRSYTFGSDLVGGEFVFIPRAPDAEEADGWLMGLVIDAKNDTTQLQVFKALDIEQGPIGAVHVPHRIPPGFHGNWIPD